MKQSYKEILPHIRPASFLSYADNKFAAFLVYIFQGLPLTANIITLISFLFVLIASLFLLVFDNRIVFILFLIVAYTFDNADGIWARLKNQTSEFGGFFDGFMDSVKYFAIDLTLIIFYFDKIRGYIRDPKVLVLFFSLYFIFRGLFYLSYFQKNISTENKRLKIFAPANPAERYIIVFPLVLLRAEFFILYIIGFFLMYIVSIFNFLIQRLYYKPKN